MDKPLVISTLNLKGGCGKSSLIINLGGVFHENGSKPLLIDLDPQKSATKWAHQGEGKFPFPVVSIDMSKNVSTFKDRLNRIVKEHGADTVLFDTPPQLEQEAFVAALLSNVVIVPIGASPLDIWAAEEAISTARQAQTERKDSQPEIILTPTKIVANTVLGREISSNLKRFNESISKPISMRVAVAESAIAGVPVNIYSPGSPSHREFTNLRKFILNKIRK